MKRYTIFMICFFLSVMAPFAAMGQKYSSPQKTFEIYKEAAKIGNVNVYLDCITERSHQMLLGQLPSKEVLQQEYEYLKDKDYGVNIKEEDDMAILFFKINTEYETPYLFLRVNDEWKVDLKGMEEKIYFDENNKWYILGQNFAIPKEDEQP